MLKYFETHWKSKELLKHFLIVTISTNLIVSVIHIFLGAITSSSKFYFREIFGFGPLICSLIVAYKRAIPEHSIKLFKRFSLRVKYAPTFLILVHFILWLFNFIHMAFYTHTVGMLVSWIYIRYYKIHDGRMGDRSETFSFISFFPDSFAGHIKPVSTFVYSLLVNLNLLPPLPPRKQHPVDVESQQDLLLPETVESLLDSGQRKEEEQKRRRELAEKALADRMKEKKNVS